MNGSSDKSQTIVYTRGEVNLMVNRYSSCSLKSFTKRLFECPVNTNYIGSPTKYYLLTLVFSFYNFNFSNSISNLLFLQKKFASNR